MDNFEKIIKQKVEQFNVPYNDAPNIFLRT